MLKNLRALRNAGKGASSARLSIAALACLLGLLLFTGTEALAAEEEGARSGPRIQKFEEIERGFWLRSNFGISLAVMNHFGGDDTESPIWPPGPVVSLEMGIDFGQVASIHLAIHGQQVTGTRNSSRGSIPNDSTAIGVLLGGRFNFVTTKRLGWFIKAGVGYMLSIPDLTKLDDGLVAQAGTGIEYATSLRHFFIGIEVLAQYLMSNNGLGILVTPTVKYTF